MRKPHHTDWRYHFKTPVRGCSHVDHGRSPRSLTKYSGIEMNIPQNDPGPPVFVPWENISYVEPIVKSYVESRIVALMP